LRFDEAQWSSGSTARGLAVVGRLGHRDEIEEGPPHSSGTPAFASLGIAVVGSIPAANFW